MWVATTLNNLGRAYYDSGNYDKAKTAAELGLDLCLNNIYIQKKNLVTSRLYMTLAKCYSVQNDYKNGIEAVDLAMRIQKNLFDFEGVYPGLVEVYDIYGEILEKKGDYDEAEEYYNNSLILAEETYGNNHPVTAESYYYYGMYYYNRWEYSKANDYFQNAIEIRKNILGYQNIKTVKYLLCLAYSEEKNQEKEKAKESRDEAERICKEIGAMYRIAP